MGARDDRAIQGRRDHHAGTPSTRLARAPQGPQRDRLRSRTKTTQRRGSRDGLPKNLSAGTEGRKAGPLASPRAVHSEPVRPAPHAATVPYSDVGDATWFTCDQVPA